MRSSSCLLIRKLLSVLRSAVPSMPRPFPSSLLSCRSTHQGSAVLFWLRLCLGPQHHRTTTQTMSSHLGPLIETLQITRYLEQFSDCFPVPENTSDSDLSLRFEAVIGNNTIVSGHNRSATPLCHLVPDNCIWPVREQPKRGVGSQALISPTSLVFLLAPDFTVLYDLDQAFRTP